MEGLMLAEEFFKSISSGCRTGVIKFKNGDYAFINTKNLSSNFAGDRFTITVPIGFKDSIKLEYDKDWQLLNFPGSIEEGKVSEWNVVSARFDDMAFIVEQVAAGNQKGHFYCADGEKILATKDTVKLGMYYQTTRNFTVQNKKGITMYYKANLGSDICNHSQVACLNIIDFIVDEDV